MGPKRLGKRAPSPLEDLVSQTLYLYGATLTTLKRDMTIDRSSIGRTARLFGQSV